MYTLQKAKQEIDEIAKHAMDIAAHAIAMGEQFDAKLEGFKKEIIGTIEAKFAELEKTIIGDTHMNESTALSDLGAKVSLLIHGAPPQVAHEHFAPHDQQGHDQQGHEPQWHEPQRHDQQGHDHNNS